VSSGAGLKPVAAINTTDRNNVTTDKESADGAKCNDDDRGQMSARGDDVVSLYEQLLDTIRTQGFEHLTTVELGRLLDTLVMPVTALNLKLGAPGGLLELRNLTRAQLQKLLGSYGVSMLVQTECRRLLTEGSAGDVH
jgi:hypothetical protein